MLFGNLRHKNHEEHVLVNGPGELAEHRCALELVRGHLIVPGLKLDSQFVCLGLEVLHEGLHLGWNGSEIMVGKLLVLG